MEIILGWSAINEKLDSTLAQLNHLMHFYTDETLSNPTNQTEDPKAKKVKMLFYLLMQVKRLHCRRPKLEVW